MRGATSGRGGGTAAARTLFPGDKLDVTCGYDTRGRTQPVSAGFATTDEMCSFILFAVERSTP